VSDQTGGYDTRLLVSALSATGSDFAITVNGEDDHIDVQIAHKLAEKMRWPIYHFRPKELWTQEITPEIRRELVYRTNGELTFNEIYPQRFSRPALAKKFNLHILGSGGGILRAFKNVFHEFQNIGKFQPVNIERLITHRFIDKVDVPKGLFSGDWLSPYRTLLKKQIEAICKEAKIRTRNTQQMDAIYVWKMTGHSSLYLSSSYNWLPAGAPFLTAGFIKLAVGVPLRMRITSHFHRMVVYLISPSAASVATSHGNTAAPLRLNNLHLEFVWLYRRIRKIFSRIERTFFKPLAKKKRNIKKKGITKENVPFLTPEFKTFLNPEKMKSRRIYNQRSLYSLLKDSEDWSKRASIILRIATIEQICSELDFEPASEFLWSN
jgi:hypothetical protein